MVSSIVHMRPWIFRNGSSSESSRRSSRQGHKADNAAALSALVTLPAASTTALAAASGDRVSKGDAAQSRFRRSSKTE